MEGDGETFPAIPKSLHQRKADGQHRPFRPSPLSGKTSRPSSPTSVLEDKQGEATINDRVASDDLLKSNGDDQSRDMEQVLASVIPFPNKGSSESEGEGTMQPDLPGQDKEESAPKDAIAELETKLNRKIKELEEVENSLKKTEANVSRFLEAVRTRLEREYPSSSMQMATLKTDLLKITQALEENTIVLVSERDALIARETSSMIERLIEKAHAFERELNTQISKDSRGRRGRSFTSTALFSFLAVSTTFLSSIFLLLILLYEI